MLLRPKSRLQLPCHPAQPLLHPQLPSQSHRPCQVPMVRPDCIRQSVILSPRKLLPSRASPGLVTTHRQLHRQLHIQETLQVECLPCTSIYTLTCCPALDAQADVKVQNCMIHFMLSAAATSCTSCTTRYCKSLSLNYPCWDIEMSISLAGGRRGSQGPSRSHSGRRQGPQRPSGPRGFPGQLDQYQQPYVWQQVCTHTHTHTHILPIVCCEPHQALMTPCFHILLPSLPIHASHWSMFFFFLSLGEAG